MRFSTGAIFSVTVPATIIKSDWRGLGRKTSAPKRAMSKREVEDAIISIAQQARPKVSGHNDDWRAQLNTWSTDVVTMLRSNWLCKKADTARLPLSISGA
jgi:hypothetical protein